MRGDGSEMRGNELSRRELIVRGSKLFAGVLAAGALAACGTSTGGGGQTAGTTSGATSGGGSEISGEITVWRFGGILAEHAWEQEMVKKFQQQYPNVRVNLVGQDWGTKREKVISSFKNKTIADVLILDGQSIPDFVSLGILEPLDQLDPDAVSDWKQRFVPEILNTCAYKDHVYMMPTYVDMTPMLTYNTKMFQDAGLQGPPKTWDELKEYAKKLTTKDHAGIIFAATKGTNDVNMIEGLAFANGARWLAEDGKTVALDDRGWADAINLLKELNDNRWTPPGILQTDYYQAVVLFFQNKAAMALTMSWVPAIASEIAVSSFPYRMAKFPMNSSPSGKYPPASFIMTPTSGHCVTTLSKNKKAAMAWVKFFARQDVQQAWDGSIIKGRVPATKESWKSSFVKLEYPDLVQEYEAGTLFKGALPMPAFPGLTEAEVDLGVGIQSVLSGQVPADQMLKQVAAQAQAAVNKAMGSG